MNEKELYSRLGIRLKEARLKKGLTQQSLADELGIKQTSLAHYEKGTRTMSIDTLREFAHFFETTMDDLLGSRFAKDYETTTHDRVFELVKDYNLNDDEYIKLVEYLEFIVLQREKEKDPRKPLELKMFETKLKQKEINQEQTYVRKEDEKMR